MEALSDLNTFAKILTDKGYTGYFRTQELYSGKLKDSILQYLEYQKETHRLPEGELLLKSYLKWTGRDQPHIECSLWVKHLNGKFFLDRMELAKKDGSGQLLKKLELQSLTVITAPKAVDAIALINKVQKQKSKSKSRLR